MSYFTNISDDVNAKWTAALDILEKHRGTRAYKAVKKRRGATDEEETKKMLAVAEALVEASHVAVAGVEKAEDALPLLIRNTAADENAAEKDGKVHVEGGSTAHYVVLQGEVGSLTVDEKKEQPTQSILSPDATSCVVVALRLTKEEGDGSAATVTMCHFDQPGVAILGTMKKMMKELGSERLLQKQEERKVTKLKAEWYVAGGVVNFKYTLPILCDLAKAWRTVMEGSSNDGNDESVLFNHQLRGDGCCFWRDNTIPNEKQPSNEMLATCRLRGLRVHVGSGKPTAVEVKPGTRQYPFAQLRGCRFVAISDGEAEHLAIITPPKDEDDEDDIRVAIEPFCWNKLPSQYIHASKEQLLQFSTTPLMEPEDFAENMKTSMIFSNVYQPTKVFPIVKREKSQEEDGDVYDEVELGDLVAVAKGDKWVTLS